MREWVEEQGGFVQAIEEGKGVRVALELLLSRRWMYDGQKRAGVDELLDR